jgi:hypothetical protein
VPIPVLPKPLHRKRALTGGEHTSIRLDNLSHSRLLHLGHISREVLAVDTNISGCVRTAIVALLDQVDADLKKLVTMPDGDAKDLLLSKLKNQFQAGTEGYRTPWTKYPTSEVIDAFAGQPAEDGSRALSEWLTFKELLKRHRKGRSMA